MARIYNVGANGIGTKWLGGGAHRFAKTMGAIPSYDELRAWLSLDISKFDQSVLASLLLLVLFYPYFLYDRTDVDWPVIEQLLFYSMENSVAKVVKWFGDDWKVIWGLMFSGELMTSLGDSLYLEIIFECFDMWLYEKFPEKSYFRRCFRRFKDYGDDGSLGYPEKVMRYLCQNGDMPVLLKEYLRDKWRMDLKMEDTYVCFDSDPRPDMSVSCFFTQLHTGDNGWVEMAYRGPKYLKRYIVNPDSPSPWRPTVDYLSKSICIAGNNRSPVNHLVRLRALALDTFGTNVRAYEFLKDFHDSLLSFYDAPRILKAVNAVLEAVAVGNPAGLSVEDSNLFERINGAAGARLLMQGFPRLGDIRAMCEYSHKLQDELDRSNLTRPYDSPQSLAFDTTKDF